ncbi:fatty acid-binding protein [bacterium BMS3Bbin14]|nr:fatty acid-binding protein [bacterium BMS3Abin13]GBE53702.1 fatty acid-binding protein [bacterium BMS3Bbin14]HDO29642.1 DegV family EDD domain-containing protein [Desulfobacteraceae bacterium]
MIELHKAFATGYECFAAWSDLLDRINVFPVADGDTGTNLRLSLAPLLDLEARGESAIEQLACCATGNSGNIAAAFFREFVRVENPVDLAAKAALGRDRAWQAVARPCPGTMLTVFDALTATLEQFERKDLYPVLGKKLRQAVLAGVRLLPDLQRAGVVDAGALAMFIFFDGFCRQITGQQEISVPVLKLFQGRLRVSSDFQASRTNCYCVDAVIQAENISTAALDELSGLGESVVVVPDATRLKVHIHTPEPEQLRIRLAAFGEVSGWSDEAIDERGAAQLSAAGTGRVVHLMSDAAGSLTRELARQHSITLLDSYIVADGWSRPESLCSPEELYCLMRTGRKVTTAQASTFERHLRYESICRQFGRTLYLCVGSAYTGNYDTAMAWKEAHDPDNLLEVLDTGAASGRLGLIALLTSRYVDIAGSMEDVLDFSRKIIVDCKEYVFIDELQYLVAGGRLSRAGGFFGNLLHTKPVVSPAENGVRKVGVVRSREGQLAFALEKLGELNRQTSGPVIMLQYSDNKEWVAGTVRQQVQGLLPQAEILLTPLSLTSGVHMGPGTWAMACVSGC